MKRIAWVTSVVGWLLTAGDIAPASVWTWKDSFIAAFVDAEGINRHLASPYQGEATHMLGDTSYGPNELLGGSGRWWEQEWQGKSWTTGWNLNNKGNGTAPNPNDITYKARRDLPDLKGGSPTGLRYLYTAYRVFDYFITDEQGNATVNYTVNNSYHVLWNKAQRAPATGDGPVVTRTFDVNPALHSQYTTDYPARTASIFGEWERLPKDGIDLLVGDYVCDVLLTEESFHGKRAISPDTALRLARYFSLSERFWLNLQARYDLEVEKDRLQDRLEREVPVRAAM